MKEIEEEQRQSATAGKSGIAKLSSFSYWADNIQPPSLWWAPHVHSFRTLSEATLAPGAHTGIAFTTLTVDAPRRLAYLLERARGAGARVLRLRVPTKDGLDGALRRVEGWLVESDGGASSEGGGNDDDNGGGDGQSSSRRGTRPAAYINATGLGARALVPDPAMHPIRGQTVLVRGEARAVRMLEGWDAERGEKYGAYVIPRVGSGTTVLGGVKEIGDWTAEAREETTARILGWCRELAPELLTGKSVERGKDRRGGEGQEGGDEDDEGEFEVVRLNVGRRPGREGGARVELDDGVGSGRIVVHCYGHAGAGFQNSVGVAREVVGTLKDRLQSSEGISTAEIKARM
ncbi:MAG: hypothetical protein M1822_007651 [Bathelium mastoideum]|nr:MAG: hypothetical protein M1822_007651 [Bathelium mastoideum]